MNALVQWTAVTTNSDGTPITDLAGYVVYHGVSSLNYIPGDQVTVLAPTTNYTYVGLDVGITHYFNVKAVDTTGNLSAYAGEVTIRQEYASYVSDRRVYATLHRREYIWQTQMHDSSSGFIADMLGLNLPPVEPPPPETFPLYEAIGGFMIV